MDLKFITDKENINSAASLNYMFPWISNGVALTKKTIRENLWLKEQDGDAVDNMKETEGYVNYVGKGYAPIEKGGLDYNSATEYNTRAKYNCIISDSAFEELEKMCVLCKKNNIEFMVVNTPKAPYDIAAYGPDEYFGINSRISSICQKYDFSYYDFNLVKPEIFKVSPEYLNNYEHLSKAGSEAFCEAFSNFVKLCDSGDDMTNYFYDEEEYMNSVKDIVEKYLPGYEVKYTPGR